MDSEPKADKGISLEDVSPENMKYATQLVPVFGEQIVA